MTLARKSDAFFLSVLAGLVGLATAGVHAELRHRLSHAALQEKIALVERLELTDLALFTDARYARNPSMADRHTPFQDGPLSMEHFPSGTLVMPPPHLRPR
jgi:hypothetical protein